jgi:hypothetical protein
VLTGKGLTPKKIKVLSKGMGFNQKDIKKLLGGKILTNK